MDGMKVYLGLITYLPRFYNKEVYLGQTQVWSLLGLPMLDNIEVYILESTQV